MRLTKVRRFVVCAGRLTAIKQFAGLVLVGVFLAAFHPVWELATNRNLFCGLIGDGARFDRTGDTAVSRAGRVLPNAVYEKQRTFGSRNGLYRPSTISLRQPSSRVHDQIQGVRQVAFQANGLHDHRKAPDVPAIFTASFLPRVPRLLAVSNVDSFDALSAESLRQNASLRVIPICDLFQNLLAWSNKRIAVRGEFVSSMEGAWIIGRCESGFSTHGYRWPVSLSYSTVAYNQSKKTAELDQQKWPLPSQGQQLVGQRAVVKTATFIGRLHMRSQYIVTCQGDGTYGANGFGHLNGAAAELIVDSVRDVELAPQSEAVPNKEAGAQPCSPSELSKLCSKANSLPSAAFIGCIDQVREFLAKLDVGRKDSSESQALVAAIRGGHVNVVNLLLRAGAPANAFEMVVESPLEEAARRGDTVIMNLLLDAGAKVDAVDHSGRTVLVSTGFFNPKVTKLLLEAGADVNAMDNEQVTALMRASSYGFKQTVGILLEHHADVDYKDSMGRTALMYAASSRFPDVIPALLNAGANPEIRDYEGKTAFDIAEASNNSAAVAMLSRVHKK